MTTTPDVSIGQTVYVTKYALMEGVEEAVVTGIGAAGGLRVRMRCGSTGFIDPSHWYSERDAAVAKAKAILHAEAAQLEAEAARLRALTF